MKNILKQKGGFGMVEVIIGLSVASILLLTFTSMVFYSIKIERIIAERLEAALYLREMVEIARDLEKTDWESISTEACPKECYPDISGNRWVLVNGSQEINGGAFTRSIAVEPVYRDKLEFPNSIVEEPGVLDPNTKKVVATIAWSDGQADYKETLETYVYNN